MFKLALAALAFASSLGSATEIQILLNYTPDGHPHKTGVLVSTVKAPISLAEALKAKNGLCYKGALAEVNALLGTMAAIYNEEQDHVTLSKVVATPIAKGSSILHVSLAYATPKDLPTEIGTWSWDAVPVCVP